MGVDVSKFLAESHLFVKPLHIYTSLLRLNIFGSITTLSRCKIIMMIDHKTALHVKNVFLHANKY